MDDINARISDALNEGSEEVETKEEVKTETENAAVALEKIKIGDEEYTQEELSKLVGLGKIGLEAEEKYSTKIDRVWPEYTKATNEKKELATKVEDLTKQLESIKAQKDSGEVIDEDEIKKAKDAARRLGIVLSEDLPKFVDENSFREKYLAERSAEKLLEEADDLALTYDGKDGRPKFDTREILEYMKETGIRNPERAYKDKYETQLDAWKEAQLGKTKKNTPYTESSSNAGGKTPSEPKITRDNLQKMVSEALEG